MNNDTAVNNQAAPLPPAIPCPNCRQQMQDQDLARHDHGTVRVHLCFACAGIWFDPFASAQLAPAAVIELFKEISSRPAGVRQPVANQLSCPRCKDVLALSFDLSKSGRFSYFMCHRGDGRFTPFMQFLREKQFVRTLSAAELQRVRSQVRQITCSECGAPIDLEHDSQCKYCHAPVSFLDPDAVEKAVRMWSDADQHRHLAPSPEALGEALLRTQIHRVDGSLPRGTQLGDGILLGGVSLGPDLVTWGIHAIGQLFAGRG